MGRLKLLILILFTTNLVASVAFSQDASVLGLPALSSTVGENGEASYSLSLQILVLMTVLTVVPSIVLGMTAFTRVIIVLSILRQALGTQQTPPNQVLIAIALFITFYVMSPIFEIIYETADLWFHTLVMLAKADLKPQDILDELARREGLSGIDEKNARTKD